MTHPLARLAAAIALGVLATTVIIVAGYIAAAAVLVIFEVIGDILEAMLQ